MRFKYRFFAGAAVLSALLLAGCAPYVYRSAFKDYGDVYAEAQNHQMLLNLARLSQHHPSYFFQSGNIQANYTLTGQFTAAGGQTTAGAKAPPFPWLVNTLQLTGTRISQPTFNFVPLVGGDFAAHLVTPLSPDLFNAFFQSGFPVDILMRTMVQQVQFTIGTNEQIIINSPAPENADSFARYLRLCDMLRDLQEQGYLLLERHEGGTNGHQIASAAPPEISSAPSPKELMESMATGYNWTKNTNSNTWHVDAPRTNGLSFLLTPHGLEYLNKRMEAKTAPYNHPDQVSHLLFILNPESSSSVRSHVVLRSFLFVLQSMATEEDAFESLTKDPAFSATEVPPRQFRPVLQMKWSSQAKVFPNLMTVSYQGNTYTITDPVTPYGDYSSYNRDAFFLACTLFTQISLDPAKLNYQSGYLLVR